MPSLTANPLTPLAAPHMVSGLASGQYNEATMVWREGFADWQPVGRAREVCAGATAHGAAPISFFRQGGTQNKIDDTIFGNEMQFVDDQSLAMRMYKLTI